VGQLKHREGKNKKQWDLAKMTETIKDDRAKQMGLLKT
jgi:hypothetical protein